MIKTKKFTCYRWDNLESGKNLKIERKLYMENNGVTLKNKNTGELCAKLEAAKAQEAALYEKAQAAADRWTRAAAAVQELERALDYQHPREPQHSGNAWEIKDESFRGECRESGSISNRVYKMWYRIYERNDYRDRSKKKVDVSWYIYTNSPLRENVKITGQDVVFSSLEAAKKYLEGRKSAYSHFFAELNPRIPEELQSAFTLYGELLPGYRKEKKTV